jgi:serine/threonine protein phosphatase PrpC
MMSSLRRSSPPLYNGDIQPVQTWLTNVQTWLLSDAHTDHVAAILEHANALLHTHRDTDDASNEGKPLLELQVGSQFDRGIRRKQSPNEDSLFAAQGVMHSLYAPPKPFALFMVADGMGGHANGQEASQLAVQSLVEDVYASLFSEQMTPDAFLSLLVKGVQYANQAVYQRNQEYGTDMGTTMTVTLVNDSTAYVAHVGDSRAYLYHEPAGLSQITRDHSIVASLVTAGIIQPDDIYTHPMRNHIYRCLGQKPTVEVDTCLVSLTIGDTLLLCSDGLWEMVRDAQIASILTTPVSDPAQIAERLVQAALAGGGEDNVSAIVVQLRKA